MLSLTPIVGQSLNEVLTQYLDDSALSKAQNSILALDLTTGDTLMSFQSSLPLITASTTKVFSTALALEVLGREYRFSTQLFYEGKLKDSILSGNIWIRGLGDVSFGSRFFHEEGQEMGALASLIDSLYAHGIKTVKGSIYIDGSAYGYAEIPQGWSAWDAGNYFGSFAAGINFYDNAANYYFSTGKAGRKAQFLGTYPNQAGLKLKNQLLSARIQGDHANLQGEPYSEVRIATGKLPAYQDSFRIRGSVADPERSFADALTQVCFSRGFTVSKGVFGVRMKKVIIPDYDAIPELTRIPGRTVGELIHWTNGRSVNFFAEGLLNGVAYYLTGCGSNQNALKVYGHYLASRIDTANLRLYDGSGLSRKNRISASHLCGILSYVFNSSIYQDFKNSLPVAGKSGTLKDLCKGQPGENKVFAKSGTMTGIKSYAGYVESITGRKIVFTFISSGYSCSQSYVKHHMELLINALASL